MNFIKKKLKSHKKDDEEEEYEKAVYEQSLHPQNPDQKMKSSEEWQFFQQLSMRVQDTVQKTQTTLNKLKDTRQEDGDDEDGNVYDVDGELLSKDIPPYGKVLRAPPRPPPPSAEKAAMSADLDFASDLNHSSPSKGPPRPPPPGSSDSPFTFDSSALHGTPSKSYGSPARPPPPNAAKLEHSVISDNFSVASDTKLFNVNAEKDNTSFSLLDEFGFNSDTVTSTAPTNIQDLLFLDDKEVDDPFDTSFVDVNNPTSVHISSERKSSGTEIKSIDKSFNPFSSSSTSDDWLTSTTTMEINKSTATNPFFSGVLNEVKPEVTQEKRQSISSHNPFSFNEPVSGSEAQNDLFGLNLSSSPSKDNLTDIFQTSKESPKTEQTNEDLLSVVFSNDNAISLDASDNIIPNESEIIQSNHSNINHEENIKDDIWQTDHKEESRESREIISNETDKNEAPETSEKSLDESLLWDTEPLEPEVLQPEKSVFDYNTSQLSEKKEEDIVKEESSDILSNDQTDLESLSQPVVNAESLSSPEINKGEILQPTLGDNESQSIAPEYTTSKTDDRVDLNLETFNSTVFNGNKTEMTVDASEGFDTKPIENTEKECDEMYVPVNNECFSKPFDDENEENAFVFKVSNAEKSNSEFDAFAAKFESVKDSQGADAFDPFMSKRAPTLRKIQEDHKGFDSMDEFDPFKVTVKSEEPQNILKKEPSRDSFEDYDNEVDFSVVIRPKVKDSADIKLPTMEPPKLLPPPKTPTKAFDTPASRFNPFDKDFLDNADINKAAERSFASIEIEEEPVPALGEAGVRKSESVETPLSPLFDEDTSLPLETFPKPYEREGWEMVLRQPNKKKLTGNRFWKKIFVKLSENSVLQLFNKSDDKLPFQELPLQACYSLSEIGAQQYDQYGKIFTVKLQYKFYRERVGVRPGQISKVTQGQVTSMGDVAKLGLPLQHSPQTSQLLKIGSQSYSDMKFFIQEVEDALFRMVVHRDRVLTYKTEEVQVVAQDEFYVEQSKTGHIDKQLARVRIFFLAFITGMPSVEVGLNDINRQGKEVVGRYDIIPVVTEEWIRLEDCEFHSCVEQDEFHKNRVIKFHPPDACLFELLRYRIRPPKNRELPLQVRVFMTVSNTRVEIRSDILVPGYSSRKQGQVPCENIQIRFPVPECWIYLFRTEKHFRYGSKKSAARRPGKIKGLERIIGAAQNLDPSLIEVSAGQAKYEHVFHAVVWRIPRLPKEGQGAYTQQLFLLRTELTSFDQIPESFEQYVDVEFTMPATYVSHTTVRSVSVTNPVPPEKYVKYISKHEYKVEIDFKNSSDEIDGLISSPSVNVPVTTTPAVQESTEDEEKDDDSD